jgi:hypothetical protein
LSLSDRSTLPIIILGLGRSGSTVVCEMLNAHSRIYISDESWLFYRAARDLVDAGRCLPPRAVESTPEALAFTREARDLAPRQPGPPRMGEIPIDADPAVIKSAWSSWLNTIYSNLAEKHHKVRYGDKCPGAAPFAETIEYLLDGRCVYIWTVRHPIDLALSWLERWDDPRVLHDVLSRVHNVSRFQTTSHDSIRAIFSAYLAHACYLQELLSQCRSRVLVCHYERLVCEPEQLLAEVHSFLGESLEEGQIARAFAGRRQVSGGDPKFNGTDRIHRGSMDRWKRLSRVELAAYLDAMEESGVLECLSLLGYETSA